MKFKYPCFWEQMVAIFKSLEAKAKGIEDHPELAAIADNQYPESWYFAQVGRLWEIISAAAATAAKTVIAPVVERLKTIEDSLEQQKTNFEERIIAHGSATSQQITDFERRHSLDYIARHLLNDPNFVSALASKTGEADKSARETDEADKRASIGEIIAKLRGINDPKMVNENLVNALYDARILYRVIRGRWEGAVETALADRDQKMTDTILSMVNKAYQKKVDVVPFAKTLVTLGVNPEDQATVRAALTEEDSENQVVPYLKKS